MTATAEVRALPGIRLLPVQRLPLERRKELLRQLALDYIDLEPENVQVLLSAWAHDSLTGPALKASWLDYRARVSAADGIADGVLDWRDIDDELLCSERTAAAIQIAHADAEEALHHLAAGDSRGAS